MSCMEHHFKTIHPNAHSDKGNRADRGNIGVGTTTAAPGYTGEQILNLS